MAIKKDKIILNYDTVWFKTFMDSYDVKFYNREVFVTNGLRGRSDIFMQMLGNIGAYARTVNFDKDVDVIVFSDYVIDDLKHGFQNDFIIDLEKRINASNTPYRKLKFTTEALLLDFLKTRATGSLRQNQKSLKEEKNSIELNISLEHAIERDEQMLHLLKIYKDSASEPKQIELF